MLIAVIVILSLITAASFVLLIINIAIPASNLTVATIFIFAISVIGWMYVSYYLINQKRRKIFLQKIENLDRENEKLENLFALLDFIEGKENDLDVVKSALNGIYFSPSSMRKRPQKAKKKELYNLLIEYYLTLTKDKYKENFIWDYNINFFTWRCIGLTSLIGLVGIGILSLCYNFIPHPNYLIYTVLYFFFGALFIPLIAKFFGHII